MKSFNIRPIIALFFLPLLCIACSSAKISQKKTSSKDEFSITAEKTLDETWARIIKHNFSDNRVGKKWQNIYTNSRPVILKSRTPHELITSINQMINKLGQSHIHLMQPISRSAKKAIQLQSKTRENNSQSNKQESASENKTKTLDIMKGKPADPGLRLCVADNKLCVLSVKKGSSSDVAGVKMGERISSIHGFKFDLTKHTDFPWDMMAEDMLTGTYNRKVPITIIDKQGVSKKIIIKRTSLAGKWIRIGAMLKISGKVEYKILKGNIGYIFMTPCFPQQLIQMHRIIRKQLKNCRGLIIDVRNNPGGMMLIAQGMAGWLSDKELKMGTMKTQKFPLQLKSYPQKGAFKGPLAVLINRGTFSTAEVFAAGIKDNKRGKLFGETTGGKCLPSVFFVLSTGYRLQTVFGDFVRINGKRIEHNGVEPNISLLPKQKDLLSGIDTVSEAARKWLIKQ